MFTNDYIMREIESLTKMLAKLVFRRELPAEELIGENHQVSGVGFFRHLLFQMLSDGRVNQAENLLHEQIELEPLPEYLTIAADFYARLAEMSDGELSAADFSREEIADGLAAIKRMYPAE